MAGKKSPARHSSAVIKRSHRKSKDKSIEALRDLRYERAKLQLALTSAHMGIWEWYIKKNIVVWTDDVHVIFGVTRKEFDGTFNGYVQLIHPDDKERVLGIIQQTLTENKSYFIQHRVLTPAGTVRWIEAHGEVFLDRKGTPTKMTGTVMDITEIKARELERDDWKIRYDLLSSSAGLVVYDYAIATGSIIWSGSIWDVLGYSSAEMGDINTWSELIHPDDRQQAFTKLEIAEQGLTPYEVIYRFRKKSGEYLHMHDKGFFLPNEQGKAYRMLGVMQDISQQKRSEELIRENNIFRESIANTMPGVLFVFDLENKRNIYRNRMINLGYSDAEIKAMGYSMLPALCHPDDLKTLPQWTDEPFGCLKESTFRLRAKSGEWRWFMSSNTVFQKNDQGNVTQVIGILLDVTQQKEAEENLRHALTELKESEQRFRTLQTASFGGIGLHDQGYILDCNQGLCDLTGYTRDELIGTNGLLLFAPECQADVLAKVRSGDERPYDTEAVRKDGTRISVEVQGKNLPYKGKTIRVSEFRDITERKKTESKILEQNARLTGLTEELKNKNEQLEEFTQIVSHNLRSPVGNILTLLNFFEEAHNPDEKTEYLRLLKESGANALNTLHELNEVLKIKQNRKIEKQELQFRQVLATVKGMLSATINEVGASIQENFVEAPVIHYPKIYLESILLNLLSNALKYVVPGRAPLIQFKSYLSNNQLILEASDNGLGINLERYGHQVFKLRKTFHRHPESRGIGLFMIKNQIEAMGGEITLASQELQGTTFFINFNKYQSDGN